MAKSIPAFWRSAPLALLALVALAFGAAVAPTGAPQKKKSASKSAAKAQPAPGAGELAALVHAYRGNPTAAHRKAVETYAAAHAKDGNGSLAHLALGVVDYERRDYSAAIAALKGTTVPAIADYIGYYLAAARVESHDLADVGKDAAPAHAAGLPSPLSGRAWLLEARALKGNGAPTGPVAAVALLRAQYAELPQPEGDVTLADCYLAAKDFAHAADSYQRVYYRYVSGDASARAAAALTTLKDAMGDAYPAPPAQLLLGRADRMLDARDYVRARAEYRSAAEETAGLERDQARVRMGAAQFLAGNTAAAYPYLRGLQLAESEADAERLYYLAECARRLTDDDEMMAAVKKLGDRYPKSQWRAKALASAADRFLLANRPDDYIPLYKAAYQDFPAGPDAARSHWKVTFHAWMRNQDDAVDLLREHLRVYSGYATNGAALYFLGRSEERDGDFGAARAAYQSLSHAFQNTYYAILARERMGRSEIAGAARSEKAAAFLAGLALPAAQPVPAEATRATSARVARSRLLRTAGLGDLADSELRFGARTDGQPSLLAMEAAGSAGAPRDAMRLMKNMAPEYLTLPVDDAPRKFWEYLFPLPYRDTLMENARARDLDPYLVAGLVRQESEFDPQALSHANAYGLAQVRPATGRLFAKQAGIRRFTNRLLFQPAINLKLGTLILRNMLDQQGGKLEVTLAAYNAGPNRAAEWLQWNTYREPAEFVESIPYTETRDYVQAVLRNADMYRRLYGK
ncbi:MAG: lytic transglycosylase domain-containing protein [Bryobacteraceae bacterium]